MDRWVVERVTDKTFGLYDIKASMSEAVAHFHNPEIAYRCAELLNKHGEKSDG